MKKVKARSYKYIPIIFFVVLYSGISLPTSSVSAATISSQIQKKSCHTEDKKDVRNEQGEKVGFVYAWTDTCNNHSSSHVQACNSSTGSPSISIKFGQLSITC